MNAFGLYGTRSSWSDKKRSQLEDELPTLMPGILACGARLKERRAEDMERKRRHKIYQRRQARMAHADKLRTQRIQTIEQMVTGLERAQAIRTCLAELQRSPKCFSNQDKRHHRWAEQLARHYDPRDAFTLPIYDNESAEESNWML